MPEYRFVPNSLEYAVDDYGDYASDFDRQAGKLNAQAGKLNSMSNAFRDFAENINSTALDRLVNYGEVNESDLLGNAVTDNTLAYGKAWDAAQRDLLRRGVNPNSGRFAGMSQSFLLNKAAAEAGARNQARLMARNENYQRANALASLGYNYNSLGLNAANSATSAYNSATGAYNQGANVHNRYVTDLSGLNTLNDKAAFVNSVGNYGRQQIYQQNPNRQVPVMQAEALSAGMGGGMNNALNLFNNK
jgi:hypothetical protein